MRRGLRSVSLWWNVEFVHGSVRDIEGSYDNCGFCLEMFSVLRGALLRSLGF